MNNVPRKSCPAPDARCGAPRPAKADCASLVFRFDRAGQHARGAKSSDYRQALLALRIAQATGVSVDQAGWADLPRDFGRDSMKLDCLG